MSLVFKAIKLLVLLAQCTNNVVSTPLPSVQVEPSTHPTKIPTVSASAVEIASEPVTEPPTPVKHYVTLAEWEKDAMGLCPHEQPDSPWRYVYYSPSIDVSGLTYTSSDLYETVNVVWNDFKAHGLHRGVSYMFAFAWQMGYPHTYGNGKTQYWVNWEDFTITYTNTVDNVVLTEEYIAQHDATAQEATRYLRWLENTYNAKCPNN